MLFADRRAAGRFLATKLSEYADRSDVVVLGLPRGGVLVAAEVAKALRAPLDVFVVRKLGVPELAFPIRGGGRARQGISITRTHPLPLSVTNAEKPSAERATLVPPVAG
jgi:hypothetical protein